jgi:hypothetical protein
MRKLRYAQPCTSAVRVQEFYDAIERHRGATVEALVKKYRTIPQLLGKMEEVVAGSNTGRTPKLAAYYHHWEMCVFNALNTLVLNGMDALLAMMQARSRERKDLAAMVRVGAGADRALPALFKVRLSLSNPEILVSPTLQDMSKMLSKLWRNMVESTKMFVRWMHGTCVETPEQHVGGEDDEPFVYSFYNDVQMNPVIIKAILSLDNPIRKAVSSVKQCAAARSGLFGPLDRQGITCMLQRAVGRALLPLQLSGTAGRSRPGACISGAAHVIGKLCTCYQGKKRCSTLAGVQVHGRVEELPALVEA